MKRRLVRTAVPLQYVKPICVAATLAGVFFVAAGLWLAGLCMLIGAYLLEKNAYCCPKCGKKLDMKRPLLKGAGCPFCGEALRQGKANRS